MFRLARVVLLELEAAQNIPVPGWRNLFADRQVGRGEWDPSDHHVENELEWPQAPR